MLYVIWWLDSVARETVCTWRDLDELVPGMKLPAYMRRQIDSCGGRAGRGRLWIDPVTFQGKTLEVPDQRFETSLTGLWIMRSDAAGIVILRSDLGLLERLPGLATDFELRRVVATNLAVPQDRAP